MKKYTKKTLPPEEDDIPWQSGKNPFVPDAPTKRPKKKLPIERKPIERINANPFHATGVEKAEVNVISKKRYNTDMDVFKTEWAITEPTKRPHDWLMEEKGYTLAEARDFINSCGGVADWDKERLRIQNKALGHVIKRHVDSLVEVNEIHIKSSKLVNARALEMLSNNCVEFIDKDGNKRQSPLRPSDLHNIVNVVERAQFIYRRAMGLPNDDGGLQQVLANLVESALSLSERFIITPGCKNLELYCQISKPTHIGCWTKTNAMSPGRLTHFWTWEPVFFYGTFKKKRGNDVFNFPVGKQPDTGNHTCPKPIALWIDVVENFSEPKDTIFDFFLGSGSTLIACEKTGRKCYGMELDPHYCSVIIKRWQDFTGKQAVKL